jgi:hypothetical protein
MFSTSISIPLHQLLLNVHSRAFMGEETQVHLLIHSQYLLFRDVKKTYADLKLPTQGNAVPGRHSF